MFDFYLSAGSLTVSEKLSIGGQVTLLGMGTVFSVLILLWGLVEVLHLLLGHKGEKKVNEAAKIVVTAPINEQPKVKPVKPTEPVAKDDLSIIAVITAAIAAASGQSPSSFRVVSFKRANNKFSYRK